MCLTKNGKVYSFGNNAHGELGLGHRKGIHTPKRIPNLKDIAYISAGTFHSLCITKTGEMYGFGSNHLEKIGLEGDDDKPDPVLIPGLSNVTYVTTRCESSLVLSQD